MGATAEGHTLKGIGQKAQVRLEVGKTLGPITVLERLQCIFIVLFQRLAPLFLRNGSHGSVQRLDFWALVTEVIMIVRLRCFCIHRYCG